MKKHWLFLRHGTVPLSVGNDPALTKDGLDQIKKIANVFQHNCHLVGKRPVTLRFALSRTQRVRETLDNVYLPLSEQIMFDMPILKGTEKGIWSTAQLVLVKCEYYCSVDEPQFVIVVGHGDFPVILAKSLWQSLGGEAVLWQPDLQPASGYLVSVGHKMCNLRFVSPTEPEIFRSIKG